MLDDKDDWVKLNAAGALAVFKCSSGEAIEKLQSVKTADQQLQKKVTKSIGELRAAKPDEQDRKAFEESLSAHLCRYLWALPVTLPTWWYNVPMP